MPEQKNRGPATRIIPCLDVDQGRVVKGVNFVSIRDAGDPVEVASRYNQEGADEITFLDITASSERRKTMINIVAEVAEKVFIPLLVGGGIRTIDDIRQLLLAGADKVSINSAAIEDPTLVQRAVEQFGSQCIVVAIDAKRDHNIQKPLWHVYTHGGRKKIDLDVMTWVETISQYGAGEILLTSMDRDGTRSGFDLELLRAVGDITEVPIIASGGVGTLQHLLDGVVHGKADALLAASIFHDHEYSVHAVKAYLHKNGIHIRL